MATTTCDQCGKLIERDQYAIDKSEHHFCDHACFGAWRSIHWCGENNPSWQGGHTQYRGANWPEQRRLARRRDNDTCQHCGVKGHNLPVHHLRPFHFFKSYKEANKLGNLITLCPTCHSKADQAFYREHPDIAADRIMPTTPYPKICRVCGKEFMPRSNSAQFCDDCCTFTCRYCGKAFYTRRIGDRTPVYCSRECRNADIRRAPQICPGCGKEFVPDRNGVKYCSHHCRMTKANPRRLFFAKRKTAAQVSNRAEV